MGLTTTLDAPFFGGSSASTTEVPGRFPVALNGRPYQLDLKSGRFGRRSIPLVRAQADDSVTPGEGSISREDLWRSTINDWSHGAGQVQYDRPDSDPRRFRSSKGIDVWDRWELSLLPATDQKRASVNTNLALVTAGAYLYVADGNDVFWTQDSTVDSPVWTSSVIHVAEAAQSVKSITSDGYYVYAALGSNGVHRTVRGASVSSHYSDLSCTLLAYVKGRLMAANGNAIYNITASGAAPSALFTHPNTDFTWVGFAGGQGHIYAAGYSGDKSLVYRIAVKSDGTALDVPVVAGELTDGEIARIIDAYVGFAHIGTDKGVRFAEANESTGNLTMGALVKTEEPVRCFEGQDRYVWFGLSNYDGASTGLGRLDLSTVGAAGLSPLTPAYASDLMAAAQGSVLSIVTFQDRRVFAVSGSGIWGQDSALVASGSLDSGKITYGLADLKVAMYADIRHLALQGTVSEYLSTDGGSFVLIGTNSTAGSLAPAATFPAGQARGESFELRTTLARATTDTTTGPTVTRMTLRSFPSPARGRYFQVPLLLHDTVLVGDSPVDVDVVTELGLVESLESSRDLVTYQEGAMSYTVLVEDTEWVPYDRTQSGEFWNGTLVVTLKKFSDT